MFKKLFIVISISLLMIGCTSKQDGSTDVLVNETNESISSKIIKGKTTKNEIRALFGEPSSKFLGDGNESWSYFNNESTSNPLMYVPLFGSITCLASDCYQNQSQNLNLIFNGEILESYNFYKNEESY